jgi:hypothetical protein
MTFKRARWLTEALGEQLSCSRQETGSTWDRRRGGIVAQSPNDEEKPLLQELTGISPGRGKGRRWRRFLAVFLGGAAILAALGAYSAPGKWVVQRAYNKMFAASIQEKRLRDEKQAEADRIAREKQAVEDRRGNLVAGVTLSSFRSTLGDDKPEYRFPPSHPTREIYVSQYDYVQVWIDSEQSVAAFSVTARTKDFHPAFSFQSQKIVLGQSTIADAFGPLSKEGQMALGGTCPAKTAYYYEALKGYWSRSQTVAVGIASVGAVTDKQIWSSLCIEKSGRQGEAGQRLGECKIDDFHPNNYESVSCFADSPVGKKFRQDAIINVFAITAPDGKLPEEDFFPQARLAPHEEELSERDLASHE